MAGTYPTTPKFQSMSITSKTQTYASVAQNMSVETRTRGVQRWEVSLQYPPLTREEAMQVYAFIISQQGSFDTFQFAVPDVKNCLSPTTQVDDTGVEGTPMTIDQASTIGRNVQVANFNRSKTVMEAGQFFKFSDHAKVYMVTADLVTDSVGKGLLSFTPPILQQPVAGTDSGGNVYINGTTIVHTEPAMDASLTTDDFEIPIDENVFYALNVKFGERVAITTTT